MPAPENVPAQNPYGPLITFKSTDILPPSAIYVGPNDTILIQGFAPTVPVTLNMAYRLLRPDGTLIITSDSVSFGGPANPNGRITVPPSEGFLLSMMLFGPAASRGQLWCRVFLVPGGLQPSLELAHLFMQGYASNLDQLSFPQSPTESSLNGRGWLHDVLFPNTAGTPSSIVVPSGVHWLIRCATISLSTSAAIANRLLEFAVLDPTPTTSCRVNAPAVEAAATTSNYTCAPGINSSGVLFDQTFGIPNDLIVPTGWTVRFQVNAMDVADQLSSGVLTVEEFVGQ